MHALYRARCMEQRTRDTMAYVCTVEPESWVKLLARQNPRKDQDDDRLHHRHFRKLASSLLHYLGSRYLGAFPGVRAFHLNSQLHVYGWLPRSGHLPRTLR